MRARKKAPNSRENSTNKDYLLGNKQSLLKIWRPRSKILWSFSHEKKCSGVQFVCLDCQNCLYPEFIAILQKIPNKSLYVFGIYCNFAKNSE